MDRANTRQPSLLPIPNDVARLRKSVISTMRSFTVAPVAFPACTQQAFLLETVFDVLAKINTDAPVNPGHAYCLIRHSRRRSRPVQEAPPWPLNVFALVEHVSLPANHEQLKWTKDDCGSRIATYVTFIEDSRPMNFIYLFISIIQAFFFFFSNESVKSNSFFIVIDVSVLI